MDSTNTINLPPTPTERLMRLLTTERKDIGYILIYALITGAIGLSLPLGTQAVFTLVSSGTVFSSVYVMIGIVILGLIITGILLVVQTTLVEILQQRVFVKAAFEFTYRLPRIEPQALSEHYAPELMNRFFDVLTIQKGLPKLLIDITTATVQIIFGLLLLSAYHPIFIALGIFIVLSVFLVVKLFGPAGLRTSLAESKYKYKVEAWLEEMAAGLLPDKPEHMRDQPGHPDPMDKMDGLVASYIANRQDHFNVIKKFLYSGVAFKTIVVGGLLILGTSLVVSRQMSLGQFVASELVIVIITGAVDKLLSGVDTIFDMLTAVEKIGTVTDLPLVETEKEHY